jgi:hypothetical protein
MNNGLGESCFSTGRKNKRGRNLKQPIKIKSPYTSNRLHMLGTNENIGAFVTLTKIMLNLKDS